MYHFIERRHNVPFLIDSSEKLLKTYTMGYYVIYGPMDELIMTTQNLNYAKNCVERLNSASVSKHTK